MSIISVTINIVASIDIAVEFEKMGRAGKCTGNPRVSRRLPSLPVPLPVTRAGTPNPCISLEMAGIKVRAVLRNGSTQGRVGIVDQERSFARLGNLVT